MNKSVLKTFATSARKELLKKVEAKAMKIGITEETIKKTDIESSDAIFIDGKQLSKAEKVQRNKLIARIKQIGFKQVMEEVAYTWFNRFTALRFMEVNDYLPTGVRVLSSSNSNSAEPDMMNQALELDLEIDKEYVYELKLNNKTEELFKYLIIKQCNDLNKYLPFMFEMIDDYTEILFPEGLLAKDSFIKQMTDIDIFSEDHWNKVEIIGWLYQYYIAEEKDRVIKAKKKYKIEEIPYATQLFTPDWIVRYLVQNSLGRYWLESHPEHRDLLESWEFYLENQNPEPDFEEKLAPYINKELKVEDIKCFDPAMGSGHILVYMFDVLYEIYSKSGYMEREIPRLIIENNLYGLDIDDRAYQLACFSIVMKALEYNNRFLRSIERDGLTLNLASIQETNNLNDEDIKYISSEFKGDTYDRVSSIIKTFFNAKLYGSLLKIEEDEFESLKKIYNETKNKQVNNLFESASHSKILELFPSLIKQSEILLNNYDALITNPPYVSSLYMNEELHTFVKENYESSKEDIYACFIVKSKKWLGEKGVAGFIAPYSWMFQSSYEKMREDLVKATTISSIVQLEYNAFEVATVQVAGFTFRNYDCKLSAECVDLSEFPGVDNQYIKTLEAVTDPKVKYRYQAFKDKYSILNGSPIAYWLTDELIQFILNTKPIKESLGDARQGLASSDNKRFLRLWFEVELNNIGFNYKNNIEAMESDKKWFPHNKGGKHRKWFGNNEWVVNWKNDGEEIKEYAASLYKNYSRTIKNISHYFREGITWSDLTAGGFSARYSDSGKVFDSSGPTLFPFDYNDIYYGLAYLNSNLFQELLDINCSGMHYSNGVVGNLPCLECKDESVKERISNIAKELVDLVKEDWDENEKSWDYITHPYIKTINDNVGKISEIESLYQLKQQKRIKLLEENEKDLNIYFYNLVGIKDIDIKTGKYSSINLRSSKDNVLSFIHYSVGCMLGRYSLDYEGLTFAGGEFDSDKYKAFPVEDDNIVPVLSSSYFEDDIVSKFMNFVSRVFGDENLNENLKFIADNIGMRSNETPKETIRRYFLNDFFNYHVSLYSTRGRKAPVYWLFTSGKQKAFNCLIYMHRYDKTTLSRIRTDYLHEYQIRLDAEKKDLLGIIEGDYTTKEISNAKKELKALGKKIEELKEYDELLHHMADMQIEIDLDDGVVVNYEKFKGLVAKI